MLDMIARAKGKKADVELISIGDHTRYEVIIKKVMFCKNFAFYWTNEENEIHYSGIYEFSDGTNDKFDIYNNIVKRLVPPFTEAVLNKHKTALEIKGSIKKEEFNEEAIDKLFFYIEHDERVTGKLSTISELWNRKELPNKTKCDESLLKTYGYLQEYGDGRVASMHRALRITMDELLANINTLKDIGAIVEDENYEYVITNKPYSGVTNKQELKKQINKEIKNNYETISCRRN